MKSNKKVRSTTRRCVGLLENLCKGGRGRAKCKRIVTSLSPIDEIRLEMLQEEVAKVNGGKKPPKSIIISVALEALGDELF